MTIATAVALVDLALGDGTGARPLDCTGREWCAALRIARGFPVRFVSRPEQLDALRAELMAGR